MEVQARKANTSRSPILSLVDLEYLKSISNTPRAAWEPISYLFSEVQEAKARIAAMDVPPEHEWARVAALRSWDQATAWLTELMQQSQSIDALRSWQMVRGLENQTPGGRPSSGVVPEFNQPQPPGTEKPRRAMLRRGNEG